MARRGRGPSLAAFVVLPIPMAANLAVLSRLGGIGYGPGVLPLARRVPAMASAAICIVGIMRSGPVDPRTGRVTSRSTGAKVGLLLSTLAVISAFLQVRRAPRLRTPAPPPRRPAHARRRR